MMTIRLIAGGDPGVKVKVGEEGGLYQERETSATRSPAAPPDRLEGYSNSLRSSSLGLKSR